MIKVINDLEKLHIENRTAIAIGKFDGVHIGHRVLIDEIVKAHADGLLSVVFTFNPAPEVFFGFQSDEQLMTAEEKRNVLEQMGVDIIVEYPMNPVTAALEPERFISDILVTRMNAGLIAAGPDLSFGAGGKGDFDLLKALSRQYGYETVKIDKVMRLGDTVSSTRIRDLVLCGNMEESTELLGSPYTFRGVIRHGRQLGRTIGMPTANIVPEKGKLIPPFGVYFSKVVFEEDGSEKYGISNIGVKPTVKDDTSVNIETYLYDTDGDLYGREIQVSLIHFKRPERKFADVEALKKAMHADTEEGRKYFKLHTC
ncbi:MAG: riboflavin biosynthesis protein RibF [Lachnospiraceae bacterium]|nr:riboflavin biosynthesis protein RibF [Lachnospiraceae bacterium]